MRQDLVRQIAAQPEQAAQINNAQIPPEPPYWQRVWIENGVLHARFSDHQKVPDPVRGSILTMQAQTENGEIRWHCDLLGVKFQQHYLSPQVCVTSK